MQYSYKYSLNFRPSPINSILGSEVKKALEWEKNNIPKDSFRIPTAPCEGSVFLDALKNYTDDTSPSLLYLVETDDLGRFIPNADSDDAYFSPIVRDKPTHQDPFPAKRLKVSREATPDTIKDGKDVKVLITNYEQNPTIDHRNAILTWLKEPNLKEVYRQRILLWIESNKTSLSAANLSGANLSGANLSGANLVGVNLVGAKLVGVKLVLPKNVHRSNFREPQQPCPNPRSILSFLKSSNQSSSSE